MIVRLLGGDGQYRVDDGCVEALNELDAQGAQAVEAGDEVGVGEPARMHAPLDQHRR